jgi:hypothetical protein
MRSRNRGLVLLLLLTAAWSQTAPAADPGFHRHRLEADGIWRLSLPEGQRFDASGLLRLPDGTLLTVSDHGTGLFRIQFPDSGDAATLAPWTNAFTASRLGPLARQKPGPFDLEGLARDAEGRLYLCDERDRRILRDDPASDQVERLAIDWRPVRRYFDPRDRNASFEGIAVGDDRLYLANERMSPRIVVVALATLRVVDHFKVRPKGATPWNVHYSDLSWWAGALFVLLRDAHTVLQVEPGSHRILAQYDFKSLESEAEQAYRNVPAFAGVMEGLAVDREHLWLVTDNNGEGRKRHPEDRRPTLLRCPRPDRDLIHP